MEMNASVLKTLFNRLYKFVMGTADEQVDLGDGRKLPTLSGIEKQSKSMGMLQVCRDYSTLAIANADATANRLKPGQIIRVWDDIAKFNGYYELSSAMNLVKKDLVDLIGMKEVNRRTDIERTDFGTKHRIFVMDVDRPLVGQAKHWFSQGLLHITSGDSSRATTLTFVFGFKSDGSFYRDAYTLSLCPAEELPVELIINFSEEGGHYRVTAEIDTTVDCRFYSNVSIYPDSTRF